MTRSGTKASAAGAAGQNSDSGWDRTQGTDEVVLSLSELVADENGEIVLFNDSGFRRVVLEADARLVSQGTAGPHVTAGGDQVEGYGYVAFDNGKTLYYPPGLQLVVVRQRR